MSPALQRRINTKTKRVIFIAGIFFLFLGGLIYILPMITTVKKDYTEEWYVPILISSFGLVLLWNPQVIVDKFSNVVDLISKNKSNPNS
jgi:hypothetical protein